MNTEALGKLIVNMEMLCLKQLIITAPMSIKYLTGRFINPGERLVALKVDGKAAGIPVLARHGRGGQGHARQVPAPFNGRETGYHSAPGLPCDRQDAHGQDRE